MRDSLAETKQRVESEYILLPDNLASVYEQEDRQRGAKLMSLPLIRRLANSNYKLLSDHECTQFAMQCDYTLAVKLARSPHVNPNLFLGPISRHLRRLDPEVDPIVNLLEHLNRQLSTSINSQYVRHFIKQALLIAEVLNSINLGAHHLDLDYIEKNPFFTDKNLDWLSLQAFLACSASGLQQCQLMIDQGIFLILHNLNEKYAQDVKVQNCVAMILSNLSAHTTSHRHFFVTGWLKTLVEWLNEAKPLELQLHATKILHNLDRPQQTLSKSVYLLSPVHRNVPYAYDLVFVHGLLGSVFKTWRQDSPKSSKLNEEQMENSQSTTQPSWSCSRYISGWFDSAPTRPEKENRFTQCWPRDWLANDLDSVRILGVNYQTYLSDWLAEYPRERRTIQQRAKHILEELRNAGLGERPIIWVAHSMGGLLVKQILLYSNESNDQLKKDTRKPSTSLIEQTKGIIFYSVPHFGADITRWPLKLSRLVLPSEEVRFLQKDSPQLQQLQQQFRQLAARFQIQVLTLNESLKSRISTHGLVLSTKLVQTEPDLFDHERSYMLQQDHFHICKPSNRHSLSYKLTAQFIRQIFRKHSQGSSENSELEHFLTMLGD